MTYAEVMDAALSRNGLRVELSSEKKAFDFRARCYAWRKQQRRHGNDAYDCLVIRKKVGERILSFETGDPTIKVLDAPLPTIEERLAEARELLE